MRSGIDRASATACAAALVAAMWGCAPSKPHAADQAGKDKPSLGEAKAGEAKPGVSDDAADSEALARAAQEQAERITRAMAAQDDTALTGPKPPPAPSVHAIAPTTRPHIEPAAVLAEPPAPAPTTRPAEAVAAAPATQPATQPATAPAPLTRDELLARLLEHVRTGADPALSKAMAAASLLMLDPSRQPDPAGLEPLDPAQREQVARFEQLVRTLGNRLAAGEEAGTLDPRAISAEMDRLLDEQPVHIRQVKLCRRVSGYGVYEAFDGAAFLAGRDQPVIVYVEVDHFRSEQSDDKQHEVRLSQEVVLYNDADGLAVWQHAPVEVADRSRNKRRDFFVGQPVKLPARLTVGKYRLKVRVKDLAGGSMDEFTLPLQIVADAALVRQ